MPSIYLKQTKEYKTGSITVKVDEETYKTSNLFKKFKHAFTPTITNTIWVFNGIVDWVLGDKCLTITTDTTHTSAKLTEAHVYHNQYDTKKTPLVLVFIFEKGGSNLDKYYTRTNFESKITTNGGQTVSITDLTAYTDENSIHKALLQENDSLENILTYNIGKTQGDPPNGDTSNGLYNGNKIKVQQESGAEPKLTDGFTRYKHTPANGNSGKNACVIYNKNLLLEQGKKELTGIQNKPYGYINVYFSDKVLEPLLLELNQNGSGSTSNTYYYHTWKNHSDDNSLYWKEVTKGGTVLGVKLTGSNDVHSALTGSSNGKLLAVLKAIEKHLQKTVVFMIDKKQDSYGQSDFESSFTKSSEYRLINQEIKVTDKTKTSEGKCLENSGFKVYEHDFTTSVTDIKDREEKVRLRLIIHSSSSTNQYDEITLHKGETNSNGDSEILEYKKSDNKLYVYFYEQDPRPLLICYGGSAFKPRKLTEPIHLRQVNVEYSTWDRVDGVGSCTCQNVETTGPPNQQLLEAVNDVIGYLNPVQINPTQIPEDAKTQITAEPESTDSKQATYDLHTYIPGKTIKMGISRGDVGCYHKFTYQPFGTNSKYDEKFRLGKVIYSTNSEGAPKGTLNYITNSSYKYHPVVGVTVYYFDLDSKYDEPLLIELEFKKNGGTEKEYYKLTTSGGSDVSTLTWEKDANAESKMQTNAVGHLDSIRYSLKKVVKIYIDKQSEYALNLSTNAGGENGGYGPESGKKIKVEVCEDGQECSKLKSAGYVCYEHKISNINGNGLGTFNYNDIGGLKFFISGKNGGDDTGGANDIEIKLHKENQHNGGGAGPTEINEITYNTCMKNIYVFFYCNNGAQQDCKSPGSSKPTAPLMLFYNQNYYIPKDIENYFSQWVPESGLQVTIDKPCDGVNGESQTLVNKLNNVNKSLNRIVLTHKITNGGTSDQYGIPTENIGSKKPDIELNRVKVTCSQGPSKQETKIYQRVTHRTINAFTIGDIYYGSKNIIGNGDIQVNGGGNIKVDSPNHSTKFVNGAGNNKPNTVVAYYSTGDSGFKLPQLIVLMTTDQAIPESVETLITASPSSKYGYYVLATGDNGGSYKYEWRSVDDAPTDFQLDDKTEFSLLNSIVILVDKQRTYDEGVISSAVKISEIMSPGNNEGVNRLKQKTIDPHDETRDGYGNPGQCVSKYGYKLYSHDITGLVKFTLTPA